MSLDLEFLAAGRSLHGSHWTVHENIVVPSSTLIIKYNELRAPNNDGSQLIHDLCGFSSEPGTHLQSGGLLYACSRAFDTEVRRQSDSADPQDSKFKPIDLSFVGVLW